MNDDAFYNAHADAVIAVLASYAVSPEFSKLKFRVTRNDAFNYIMLYFSTDMPFSDYEISVALRESRFLLAYITWDMATKRVQKHRLAVDDVAALRGKLEGLTPFIVEVYKNIAADWKAAFDELNREEGEDGL
jgi:hypothetical protein